MKTIKRLWEGFWQLADPKIWIASTVPMLIAFILSLPERTENAFLWFIPAFIGIYLIETGKNGVNETVDFLSGVDSAVQRKDRTPFSGGKKTIVQKKLTVNEVVVISMAMYALACCIGIIIVMFRESSIIWVGLAGVFLSLFYSIPPFKFCYHGIGEITVGITFGPLIMLGVNLLMTNNTDIMIIVASIPVGLLIVNVLWINQFPDYSADLAGNKRNMVVRLGKEKSLSVYMCIFILAYLCFPFLALLFSNIFWLIPLLTAPLAVTAIQNAKKHYNDTQKLILSNARTIQIYQLTGLGMILAGITQIV